MDNTQTRIARKCGAERAESESDRVDRSEPARITPYRLMTGTLSTLLARFVALSTSLFLTPLVIRSIGIEGYGLWAVVGSAVIYITLLDGKIGSGFVKYLAEFLERGERERIRQTMTFGASFYLGFGLLLLPVIYLLAPHAVGYLKVDPRYHSTAACLLLLSFGYFVVNNALGVFGAFIIGMQQTDVAGLIDTSYQLAYAVSLVVLLQCGYGIYSLPAAMFFALACATAIRAWLVRRTFGNSWRSPLRWESHLLRRMFGYGAWMQINALTGVINLETDRLILGTFVSVTSAAYYELGNKLASLARILPWTLLGPLLPAAAAFDGRGDNRRIDELYIRGTRYLALSTATISGFLIGAGPAILQVWMGRSYPYVTTVMIALLLGAVVNSLTGVGTTIVRAIGQPHYETYYGVLGAAVNIIATLILTPCFGLMGVVAGTVVGQVTGSIFFMWLFHRVRGLSWRPALTGWLWRLFLGITLASAFLWLICSRLLSLGYFESRLQGLAILGTCGLAYLTICGATLGGLGFWNAEDGKVVREAMQPIVHRLLPYGTARVRRL
jgi:O-antigen/teichoic acid export membrane protein